MKHYLLVISFFVYGTSFCQEYTQYFDGADTLECCSIFIEIDTASENSWQIGPPQKSIFDSPYSAPNVIMTDTINPYPDSTLSIFRYDFEVTEDVLIYGILAFQWTQKLDIDSLNDIGYIEFSGDGELWEPVFNSPFVYNFYGFENENVDTLESGRVGFQGTDSLWQDIWLCFDLSWMESADTFSLRYVFESDTVYNDGHEGWMIDNMTSHITLFHTINENEQENYLNLFPNPTQGILNIQARKSNDYHVIEEMQLMDLNGKVIRNYGLSPTKFEVDLRDLAPGTYILRIQTNVQTESFKIVHEGR